MNVKNELEKICYKKNFLKKVLIRLDFVRQINQFSKEIPQNVTKAIRINYPNVKPQRIFKGQYLEIKDKEMELGKIDEFPEFSFTNDDETKKFVISPHYLLIDHSKYETWDILKNDFLNITKELFQDYPEIESKRLGIRFINDIELSSDDNLFSWELYINKNLLNAMNFINSKKENLTRIFSMMEYKYDDYKVKFSYGMPNPEYPSIIQRKVFVLDYDAINTTKLSFEDIIICIEKMHDNILTLFEESITSKFREFLNE